MPQPQKIQYVTGDATAPIGEGPRIIVHVCNDRGGWGRGFVVAISRRWGGPEAAYRAWHAGERQGDPPFELGQVQTVEVEQGLWVANLIGQRGTRPKKGVPPVRYDAIQQGLRTLGDQALSSGASVHMPRIGCGLAGGSWTEVGEIVQRELGDRGVPVVVYDYVSEE